MRLVRRCEPPTGGSRARTRSISTTTPAIGITSSARGAAIPGLATRSSDQAERQHQRTGHDQRPERSRAEGGHIQAAGGEDDDGEHVPGIDADGTAGEHDRQAERQQSRPDRGPSPTLTAHCVHAAIGRSVCHSSVPICRSSALASDPISSASSAPNRMLTTGKRDSGTNAGHHPRRAPTPTSQITQPHRGNRERHLLQSELLLHQQPHGVATARPRRTAARHRPCEPAAQHLRTIEIRDRGRRSPRGA